MVNVINYWTWSDFFNAMKNLLEISNFRYAECLLFFTARTQFVPFLRNFYGINVFTVFYLDNSIEKENHSIQSDINLTQRAVLKGILEIVLKFMAQGLFI